MKRLIEIVISIVVLFPFSGWTQSNAFQRFPDSTFWRVDTYIYSPFNGGCMATYHFHYSIVGDTVINTNTYRKLYKSFSVITSWGPMSPCNPIPPYQVAGYAGALKEDSIGNRVYIVLPNQTSDSLLYDYNLVIGDTVRGIIGSNCKPVVQTIDSVLVDGSYHKRWNFSACGDTGNYFIKGIAASCGLVERWYPGTSNFGSSLICVQDSSGVLFSGDSSDVGCFPIYNGLGGGQEGLSVDVFPNPSADYFYVNAQERISRIHVLNFLGEIVQENTFQNISAVVNLTSFPKGLYFISVTGEKGNFGVRKVVLQ